MTRLLMPPECSAEVAEAKLEAQKVIVDEFDDYWMWGPLRSFAYLLFGPPIFALVVGTSLIWAFRWAFRGFRGG